MKRLILPFLLLAAFFSYSGKAQQNCGLSVKGTVTNTSCSGGMDGAIRLQVSGGAKPYTYHWNSGQQVQDISQLAEGSYTVTVRDQNGCTGIQKFSVEANSSMAPALSVEQITSGVGMQVLKVSFTNGKKPIAITTKKISDGIRAPVLEYSGQALNRGTYLVEAFTEGGCSAIQKITIDAN